MKTRILLPAIFALLLLSGAFAWWWIGAERQALPSKPPESLEAVRPAAATVPEDRRQHSPAPQQNRRSNLSEVARQEFIPQTAQPPPNRLEALEQIRANFTALANGDPKKALLAARAITNDVERETALMALVTQWRQGELKPPRQRAAAIATLGLEAGLGLELAPDPSLAVMWANELTEGENKLALLKGIALEQVNSNPGAAMALAEQLNPAEKRQFLDAVMSGWATKDTDAALNWAQRISDQTERDNAISAIRQVAPVGIGTAISVQDGYPVINGLTPGAPAALSGQIHPGDRIVGVAQGDSKFVDAGKLPLGDLVQMIRGAPGTTVQLQIMPADAEPGSSPRTVSILRDQIRYKQ